MKKRTLFILSYIFLLLISSGAWADKQAILLDINGAIGPATQDYIERGLDYAAAQHAGIVILRLDTPGGLATSMRGIDKAILASSIPVATYVAPTGARAASAGTFILYASHIAAMAPGTNTGAASPVGIGEQPEKNADMTEKNKINTANLSTLERKEMNDASAGIRSLAQLRGRNAVWAEAAVRDAVSLSASEALQQKVIDVIASNPAELLQKINGRVVLVNGTQQKLDTQNLRIQEFKPDWRIKFLAALTDPNIAYILLLIGIYGIFFEFYNPGFVLPGVAGCISLLLAIYAFQLLPINYIGFALLLLGICFMIIEVLISSFGVLGIGGIIAFVMGSVLLLDINSPGYQIAWSLVIMMTVFTVAFFLILISMAVRAMRRKVVTGREALIGSEGEVLEIFNPTEMLVRIHGEIWQAHSTTPLLRGQKIRVRELSGLILTVEPIRMDRQSVNIE